MIFQVQPSDSKHVAVEKSDDSRCAALIMAQAFWDFGSGRVGPRAENTPC